MGSLSGPRPHTVQLSFVPSVGDPPLRVQVSGAGHEGSDALTAIRDALGDEGGGVEYLIPPAAMAHLDESSASRNQLLEDPCPDADAAVPGDPERDLHDPSPVRNVDPIVWEVTRRRMASEADPMDRLVILFRMLAPGQVAALVSRARDRLLCLVFAGELNPWNERHVLARYAPYLGGRAGVLEAGDVELALLLSTAAGARERELDAMSALRLYGRGSELAV